MKQIRIISDSKHWGTLLLGVLVALILCASQVNTGMQIAAKPAVEQENDTDGTSADEILMISAVDAIASTVQGTITHIFYFISETILSDSPKVQTGHIEKPNLTNYLVTIFRQIISPNAP